MFVPRNINQSQSLPAFRDCRLLQVLLIRCFKYCSYILQQANLPKLHTLVMEKHCINTVLNGYLANIQTC